MRRRRKIVSTYSTCKLGGNVLVRGAPYEIARKYKQLAKDYADTWLYQVYMQHAEHWEKQ